MKLIEDNNIIYAKIIKAESYPKDTTFFTNDADEIQFGIVNFQKDYKTGAHYHNHLNKETTRVDEIFVIQQGSMRIDFYSEKGVYIKSCEAFKDDIVILYQGGHNITYYEDTKVFLIKPGAYQKENDKTRIIGANNLELIIDNN